jgi:hypothetical protein
MNSIKVELVYSYFLKTIYKKTEKETNRKGN